MTVRYEDVISKSRETFHNVAAFLKITPTPLSEMALADLDERHKMESNNKEIHDNKLKIRYKMLSEQLNDI